MNLKKFLSNITHNRNITRISIVLSIICLIFLIIISIINGNNVKDNQYELKNLNDNWTVDNKIYSSLDDVNVDFSQDKKTIYEHTITNDMLGKTLAFSTSHLNLKAYIEDELVYELTNPNTHFIHTAGVFYNFINIPIDSVGKKIRLEFTDCYNIDNNEKITFLLGEKYDIIKKINTDYILQNVVSYIFLVFGLLLILYCIIFLKNIQNLGDIICLSCFCITFATWCLTETYTFDFIFNNPIMTYLCCYYSLYAAPLFFLLYMKNKKICNIKRKKILNFVIIFHILLVLFLTLLQFLNIQDFVDSLLYFHILMFVEIILLCSFIIKNAIEKKKENPKNTLITYIAFIFFMIAVIIDVIRFYKGIQVQATFTSIFIFIYILLLFKDTATELIDEIALGKETEKFKTIAFIDPLTNINNRNKFIAKIPEIEIEKAGIISFDVNNLKYYNDTYGHDKGDKLLIKMANVLTKVFGDNAYRIGGDEFWVLIPEIDEEGLKKLLEEFDKEINDANRNRLVYLKSAYGYCMGSKYNNLDKCMKEADKNMYEHKKKLKAKSQIKR